MKKKYAVENGNFSVHSLWPGKNEKKKKSGKTQKKCSTHKDSLMFINNSSVLVQFEVKQMDDYIMQPLMLIL